MKVGTKVHLPLNHTSKINVLKSVEEGLPELWQRGIFNKSIRDHSKVTNGLTSGMMMQGKDISGGLMSSLVRA